MTKMWMVCETCGKEVCNDLNLYRHRNDTPKIRCKKCINCDVKITSTRQIRTHMKLNHKDIPCDGCKKKFYLAAARDQHKRDVHGGQKTMVKDQDQTNRDAKSGPTTVPRAPDQPNRDVKSDPITVSRAPTEPIRDVYSTLTTMPRAPNHPNRDVYSSPTTVPRAPDQPKRDVFSSPTTVSRAPDQPKRDVFSSPTTVPRAPDQEKRDVFSSPTTVPRAPDQPKRDVFSSPTTTSKDHDQRLVHSHPTTMRRVLDQAKRDVNQAILPGKPDPNSVKKMPDKISSSHKGVFKQPTHNTRFLTSFQLCGHNLKRFHEEKVRQDPEKMRRCKEIVHHLVTFLQKNCGVSEVVKGGSLGKGTSIKEKVDIDLVVYMNRFKSVADLQERREEVIKELKKHILKDFTFAKRIHYSYDTKHSNRFSIGIDDEKDLIQVDLLPACNIGGGSEQVFDEMAGLSKEERSFYSVSFAKDQVGFTKENPESVKEAIRLAKHWKTLEKLNIPSYTLEIITIKEWERMGRPEEVDLNELFKRTMIQLSDMERINITWPNSRVEEDRLLEQHGRPIVMDPANPFNNTASMIKRSDQEVIERKAREVVDWLN